MSFRVFKRKVWKANSKWPNGFEPVNKPIAKCPTVAEVPTEREARVICEEQNAEARHLRALIDRNEASAAQIRAYHNHTWYEYTRQ